MKRPRSDQTQIPVLDRYQQPRQSAEAYSNSAMSDTEWTSLRKMMDYYMDQSDGIEATQKRLYHPHHATCASFISSKRMRDLSAA